ncbi:MAG: type I pantothenate kinase [Myxococcales bacterium]|nr:type I pantothenate kinase [Myxococcales bacterium]
MSPPGSPFATFTRAEWARLRAQTPLTLTEADLTALRGINESLSLQEIEEVYLPLTRLLNLRFTALRQLRRVTQTFLGRSDRTPPFIIGLAGSVAVGKSTAGRVLQTILSRWSEHPRVDLVTTDGFLFPNAELAARGITQRKGFPESYDLRRLVRFVADVRAGEQAVAPVYSHIHYDIVPGEQQVIHRPDILILEGLNVLQRTDDAGTHRVYVSDYFDFSLYIDADEPAIRDWFLRRFNKLRETVFRDPVSYFRHYAALTDAEALARANAIWDAINGVNLRENITPTRERADLILEKAADHTFQVIRLRLT